MTLLYQCKVCGPATDHGSAPARSGKAKPWRTIDIHCRFSDLKICIAHGGGYIPGYWGRFDHAWAHREDCRVTIKKPPSEYLKKLYFDTVVFDERELKHLIEIWGADHIMLGTDYPFDMAEPDPVGFLSRVKGVSKKDMALVAGGNAERLLGLVKAKS